MSGFDFGRTHSPLQFSVWWGDLMGTRCAWVRIFGVGIHVTDAPPLFSIRYGFQRSLTIGRWRFKILKEPK